MIAPGASLNWTGGAFLTPGGITASPARRAASRGKRYPQFRMVVARETAFAAPEANLFAVPDSIKSRIAERLRACQQFPVSLSAAIRPQLVQRPQQALRNGTEQ